MSEKISKKNRNDAATICELLGNNRFAGDEQTQLNEKDVQEDIGATDEACDLACRTFCVIPDFGNEHSGAEWLEAAALLRGDGPWEPWSPGEVPTAIDREVQNAVDAETAEIKASTETVVESDEGDTDESYEDDGEDFVDYGGESSEL